MSNVSIIEKIFNDVLTKAKYTKVFRNFPNETQSWINEVLISLSAKSKCIILYFKDKRNWVAITEDTIYWCSNDENVKLIELSQVDSVSLDLGENYQLGAMSDTGKMRVLTIIDKTGHKHFVWGEEGSPVCAMLNVLLRLVNINK